MAVDTFGRRLQQLREQAGMSQAAFAGAAGIAIGTLRGAEQDRCEPPIGTAARLARFLGVPVDALLNPPGESPAPRRKKKGGAAPGSRGDERMLTASALKERGWTDTLIRDFLRGPDDTKSNPHHRSGPPMRLYAAARVEQAEASGEFRAAQDGRKGRRASAQKALATKRRRIAEYVESVEVEVPELTREDLNQRACGNYNGRRSLRDMRDPCHGPAGADSDPAFLARICVNYLRHCLTRYEDHLREIAGQVGASDAYHDLKDKVLDAIADKYDWLSDECHAQSMRMMTDEPPP
jgi:transcriptional regulator with XRE-family HTH domain